MITKTHYAVELRLGKGSWMEVATGHEKAKDARAVIAQKDKHQGDEYRIVRVQTKRTVVR